MKRYITDIKINNLFHLHDINISIGDDRMPHLFITGKNGSGKTVLLRAISDFLENIKNDTSFHFLDFRKNIELHEGWLKKADTEEKRIKNSNQIKYYQEKIDNLYGKVELSIDQVASIIEQYQNGDFVLAFYEANRKVEMDEVKNLHKPEIKDKMQIKETATKQFLYYLTDLKVQEALARNENNLEDADKIKVWFQEFAQLLRKIFGDEGLSLNFNYKSYNFLISTSNGKQFDFNQMSDGYAAILDIVVDLILRMQSKNSLTRAYEKPGIVLIDEIETHLHLQLQKDIMPLLTKVFPNIQFIVSTHSPFVLNSIENGVAYDLEHQVPISDLTQYSYSSLVEGYFRVDTESSYLDMQISVLEQLLNKEGDLSVSELKEAKTLKQSLDNLPEWSSPNIFTRYQDIKINYHNKIKSLGL